MTKTTSGRHPQRHSEDCGFSLLINLSVFFPRKRSFRLIRSLYFLSQVKKKKRKTWLMRGWMTRRRLISKSETAVFWNPRRVGRKRCKKQYAVIGIDLLRTSNSRDLINREGGLPPPISLHCMRTFGRSNLAGGVDDKTRRRDGSFRFRKGVLRLGQSVTLYRSTGGWRFVFYNGRPCNYTPINRLDDCESFQSRPIKRMISLFFISMCHRIHHLSSGFLGKSAPFPPGGFWVPS